MKTSTWVSGLVLVSALAGGGIWFFKGQDNGPLYRTAAVERGDLRRVVTATGTLNPRLVVQVGTQVSGSMARVYVDFNSKVRKGQLLAVLDTTFLRAAVEDAVAQLARAQAQHGLASKQAERARFLLQKGLSSQSEGDQAEADLASARASLVGAQAQLDRARINMRYASITAPIDGVVISRQVDEGQTVAASFNTPTLFTLADALDSMEVQANVDEADIGQVWKGQKATFSVDAYPGRDFDAQVVEVRLQPTTVQNVVQYTVILRVRNDLGKLLPGMTANVTLWVEEKKDVLKVPVTALAFTPDRSKAKGARQDKDKADGGAAWGEAGRKRRSGGAQGDSTGRVFILRGDELKRVKVSTGLSSGGFTEVKGELAPGDSVIIGNAGNSKSGNAMSRSLTSPAGGAPAGQGPRRF